MMHALAIIGIVAIALCVLALALFGALWAFAKSMSDFE